MTPFQARDQLRWMRPNAHLYIRADAYRFSPPGSARLGDKDSVRYFWPFYPRAAQLREHKFDPDQPRVPAGSPEGGQWTTDSATSGSLSEDGLATDFSAVGRQSAAYCWNQMQNDMLYCSTLFPPWRVAACRAQANERYAACLAGKPLPPLPF